jgi:hypothetical protein
MTLASSRDSSALMRIGIAGQPIARFICVVLASLP